MSLSSNKHVCLLNKNEFWGKKTLRKKYWNKDMKKEVILKLCKNILNFAYLLLYKKELDLWKSKLDQNILKMLFILLPIYILW